MKQKKSFQKWRGGLKSELILHCEKEVLFQLRNQSVTGNYLSRVECLFKEHIFFQNSEQQQLLLDALLKMPGKRPRSLIKSVLMDFEGTITKCEVETVEKAFDVLLETSDVRDVTETFKEFDVLVGKIDLQTWRRNLEERFRSHISKTATTVLLKIHQEIEKLRIPTIECYCQVLGEKLRTYTFPLKRQCIETNGNDISTRYTLMFQIFYIVSITYCTALL